jgi:hypothetical protein
MDGHISPHICVMLPYNKRAIEETSFLYLMYPKLHHFVICALRSLPYFACQAKKYSNAAKGCPIKTNDTQKIVFPMIFP